MLKSVNSKLVNVNRKAFSHRLEFNIELVKKLVKKSVMATDNEDGLFEKARRKTFIGVLNLCRR